MLIEQIAHSVTGIVGRLREKIQAVSATREDPDDSTVRTEPDGDSEAPDPRLYRCPDCDTVYIAAETQLCSSCDTTAEQIPSTIGAD